MSAFIVSDILINDTLNFIKFESNNSNHNQRPVKSSLTMKFQEQLKIKELNLNELEILDLLGKFILKNNCCSVNSRYPDHQPELDHDFKYEYNYSRISLGQYMKNLDCIDYQCSEMKDYDKSEFKKVINRMKTYGVNCIEGYDQAKWGYNGKL